MHYKAHIGVPSFRSGWPLEMQGEIRLSAPIATGIAAPVPIPIATGIAIPIGIPILLPLPFPKQLLLACLDLPAGCR